MKLQYNGLDNDNDDDGDSDDFEIIQHTSSLDHQREQTIPKMSNSITTSTRILDDDITKCAIDQQQTDVHDNNNDQIDTNQIVRQSQLEEQQEQEQQPQGNNSLLEQQKVELGRNNNNVDSSPLSIIQQPIRQEEDEEWEDDDNNQTLLQTDHNKLISLSKLDHLINKDGNTNIDKRKWYQPRHFFNKSSSANIVTSSSSLIPMSPLPPMSSSTVLEVSTAADDYATTSSFTNPMLMNDSYVTPKRSVSNDIDSLSSSSTVQEGIHTEHWHHQYNPSATSTVISMADDVTTDDNNNSTVVRASSILDAPNKPRQRRQFLLVEKIQNNRRIHRMRNVGGRRRRLLEDHYCVEEVNVNHNSNHYHSSSDDHNIISTSIPSRIASRLLRIRNRRQYDNMNDKRSISQSQNQYHHSQPKIRKKLIVLPGAPKYEKDWARDSHDFFNLIVLVPLIALNIMNWNWDMIFEGCGKILLYNYNRISFFNNITMSALRKSSSTAKSSKSIMSSVLIPFVKRLRYGRDLSRISSSTNMMLNTSSSIMKNGGGASSQVQFIKLLENSWTGEWFDIFFYCTICYFIIDLLWILIVPQAVRSPSTIIQHHIATLLYILLPYYYIDCRWCMGCCMIVEVNTWFLIARRVFNKQGFPPWTIVNLKSFLSIRIKVISILFYITWIFIRVILYPLLLIPFYNIYIQYSIRYTTYYNLLFLCIPLHSIFCLLNLKWTYDLLMSKIRYWKRLRLLRNNNNYNKKNNHHHLHTADHNNDDTITTTTSSGTLSRSSSSNHIIYYDDTSKGL